MATINNVQVKVGTALIATAPTGEVAPDPFLTLSNVAWTVPNPLQYLQARVNVSATKPVGGGWNEQLTISSIVANLTTVKLQK